MNSAALKQYGITAATEDAARRRDRAQARHEGAVRAGDGDGLAAGGRVAAAADAAAGVEWTGRASGSTRAGVTTAHEGATQAPTRADEARRGGRRGPHRRGRLPVHHRPRADPGSNPVAAWGKYDNRLKIGGVKITIDGSPQGRTAASRRPTSGRPGRREELEGRTGASRGRCRRSVKGVYDLGVPLNLHANGDARDRHAS